MADKLVLQDPTKPGLNKATGPTMVSGKVPLSGLDPAGAALNDVMAFDGASWNASAAAPSADTASNLGAGAQSFKSKVGNDFQFRSIIGSGSITATQNANDITLAGAVITASNLGAGNGLFSSKIGNDLQFKSLIAGANVTLTPSGTDITIAVSGSSGVFTESFTSSAQTITAAGLLTLAHSLSGVPTLIQARLKCISAELNYSVNDEVVVGLISHVNNTGIAIIPDATNLVCRFGSDASTFVVLDKTSGASNQITDAKWNIIIRAWK